MIFFNCNEQIPKKEDVLRSLKKQPNLYSSIIDESSIFFQIIIYPNYLRAKSLINITKDKNIIISVWYYNEDSKSIKTLIGINEKYIRNYNKSKTEVIILDDVDINEKPTVKYSTDDLNHALNELQKKII